MLTSEEILLNSVFKGLIFRVFISLTICGCVSTEICSVYNNVPISKYKDPLGPIFNTKSYDLELNGNLSINIEIKFECNVLVFNAKNVTDIGGIRLQNTANHKIYTTDDYSIDKNSILKISFARSIPQGSYNLNFNYNSEEKSPAVLSEWLVLTNFDDNHIDKKNNEAMRVWLRKSALGHGKYLVKNAEKLLRAFKNFTGVPYNRENEELFINEDNIATDNNEKLFRTFAEIIVNEAFNKYNSTRPTKYRSLTFRLKKYLIDYVTDKITEQQYSTNRYALKQRTSIFADDYIFNRFRENNIDGSFYPNGGFLVRMIAHILGKSNIDLLIQDNLQNRNGTNNTNFISELFEISGKKAFLKEVVDDWSRKSGCPVVTIERNYQLNNAIIKQSTLMSSTNKTLLKRYWIPLNFATEDNADFDDTTVTKWFSPKIESLEIATPPSEKWLICNKQQFGLYRVNYDTKNWKLIADYLKSRNYQKIHVLNRAQLIDDAFVLAEFGYLNFNIAFDLARYLVVETEYVPWATFWEKMYRLFQYSSISSSRYYEPFKKMILELSGPLERKYLSDKASNGNDCMERLNKISFIKWTCFYGSTSCNNYALTKLKNWLADPVNNPLLEDIRKEILCAGIRSANKQIWKKLLDKYLIDEDEDILHALMCSSNYKSLNELIFMFINGQLVQQNPWFVLVKIAQQSTIGLDAIIRFIDNKQAVMHRMDNHYHIDPPTGFRNNHGKVTYDMKHIHDFVDSFCTVIEQFITNNQQLDQFKKILNDNSDILGSDEAAAHLHFAQLKVNASTAVFNSMKPY